MIDHILPKEDYSHKSYVHPTLFGMMERRVASEIAAEMAAAQAKSAPTKVEQDFAANKPPTSGPDAKSYTVSSIVKKFFDPSIVEIVQRNVQTVREGIKNGTLNPEGYSNY